MRKTIVLPCLFVLTIVTSMTVMPQQVASQASRPMTEEATVPDAPDTTANALAPAPGAPSGGHDAAAATAVSTEKT